MVPELVPTTACAADAELHRLVTAPLRAALLSSTQMLLSSCWAKRTSCPSVPPTRRELPAVCRQLTCPLLPIEQHFEQVTRLLFGAICIVTTMFLDCNGFYKPAQVARYVWPNARLARLLCDAYAHSRASYTMQSLCSGQVTGCCTGS